MGRFDRVALAAALCCACGEAGAPSDGGASGPDADGGGPLGADAGPDAPPGIDAGSDAATDATPSSDASPADASPSDTGGSDAGPSSRSAGCAPGAPLPVFDARRTVAHGGGTRAFHVHVPAGYSATPTPIVFAYHGLTQSADVMESLTGLTAKSDAAGFVVVYPDGTGFPSGWNCGDPTFTSVDDVAFFGALLDLLAAELCLDLRRVYATGFSNGASMSYRLACEVADRIAAVAAVAGPLMVPTCTPSRAVPVRHFHGTDDSIVPWAGGGFAGFPPVSYTIDAWATIHGCAADSTEIFRNGAAHCAAQNGCAAGGEVTLCAIDGGGHAWPGGNASLGFGTTTTDLNATDMIWDFFAAHPMP